MPYIYHNKETKEYDIYGSLPRMCTDKGLDNPKLEYHFSRLKKLEYEDDQVKIIKSRLKRGGKTKDL